MPSSNPTYAAVVPFVDALASLGVTTATVSPGSRNTPLALAFAAQEAVRDTAHIDERSAAFFALGAAKTTGRPAAVVTTSGTAAAELLPAAIEALHARVPLLLLTADRPVEQRGIGAPQTIDQVRLYGWAVKWFHDVRVPREPDVRSMVTLASRAVATAMDEPAGPVHLNFPFSEPLMPESASDGADLPRPTPARVRRGPATLDDRGIQEAAASLDGSRALILCGEVLDPAFPEAAAVLAEAGWPILADPLSGLRAGPHDSSRVICHGDPLARIGFLDRHAPEAVIRFGAPMTSKPINEWLGSRPDIPQIVVDTAGWRDPSGSALLMLRGDPTLTASNLSKAVSSPAAPQWAEDWSGAERVASTTLRAAVEDFGFPSEPGVVLALADALPSESLLWVASSMPIRDVDAFFPSLDRPIRLLANRGANGIDGFVSTTLGSSSASDRPTFGLAGDLSLVHDLTALATAVKLDLPVTLVAIDNDGGGVFHFLSQAGHPEFERLFATPHGLDLGKAADLFGLDFLNVTDPDVLRAAAGEIPERPRLVRVPTDRAENVDLHEQAWGALSDALA